jgi:hypothetical protein
MFSMAVPQAPHPYFLIAIRLEFLQWVSAIE